MNDDVERLQAAIAAIHNHLHAGDVNAAHEACECAVSGKAVKQRNLTLSDTAKAARFAAEFNALCVNLGVRAAFVSFMPSATVPGATSIQMGGEVGVCQFIERALGQRSVYQGQH